MMIDFRYYISSLAAVFLALGIGIVIGGALMGNEEIVKGQEKLILSLEQEFDQLRAEKKLLQDGLKASAVELEVLRQFNREILPLVIQDLLTERKIGIIKTNHTIEPELTAEVVKVLTQAGAQVPFTINFGEWPDLSLQGPALASLFGLEVNNTWLAQLFTTLVSELVRGETALISALQTNNLAQINGRAGAAIDTIILLGGSYEERQVRVDEFDTHLVKAAKEQGLNIVGVEPLSVTCSYVKKYKNLNLVTVDNIDTLPGQVALILALASGEKGDYGVKESAHALLPKFPLKPSLRTVQ
ncbi:MAG: copper transporter [Firmicutes bacterium]|nr:copper transporter [Bacillota bacterium]